MNNISQVELSEKQSIKTSAEESLNFNLDDILRFASKDSIRRRNLNDSSLIDRPTFSLYTKEDINSYLTDPFKYEKDLRKASVYMYGASTHYKRIIQYFAGLSDLSYIVSPYKVNTSSAKVSSIKRDYYKVSEVLSSMDIKTQFRKVLSVCLREDVFYGTMWVSTDNIVIQQLPSDYCSIDTIESGVPNVTFNFAYFSRKEGLLDYYPSEFKKKYNIYKNNSKLKWQELDSPTSFAVKCNSDILDYSIPPFVGIFREIYDIEDYKQLKKAKTELENYALLVMKLGLAKDGRWELNFDKAKEFWMNLDSVLPEEVGSILTPMNLEKIDFNKNGTTDSDRIAESEEHLWSAAGVSSTLFNNKKASADSLLISVKADQAITFNIVKGIEAVINRYIQSLSFGKGFKVTFLDVSPYNRSEYAEMASKGMSLGMPLISTYCAVMGLDQSEMDSICLLEQDILELPKRFKPLMSSHTQSIDVRSSVDDDE